MNTLNRQHAERLAESARSPWTLDRCNDEGVTVKDSDGNAILEVSFGDFPSEWGSGMRERTAHTFQAQAQFMVLLSQDFPEIVTFPGYH